MPRPDPAPHILFLCTENACRSQIAEGWLRALSGGQVTASSAGSRPGVLNPMTTASMAEVEIDLTTHRSKGLEAVDTASVTHVITLCDAASRECPAFGGDVVRMHWPVPDPAELSREFPHLVNDGFRAIRDNIRDRVLLLLRDMGIEAVRPPHPTR